MRSAISNMMMIKEGPALQCPILVAQGISLSSTVISSFPSLHKHPMMMKMYAEEIIENKQLKYVGNTAPAQH